MRSPARSIRLGRNRKRDSPHAERFRLGAGIETVNIPSKVRRKRLTEIAPAAVDFYFCPVKRYCRS